MPLTSLPLASLSLTLPSWLTDLVERYQAWRLPLRDWVDAGIDYLSTEFAGVFDALNWFVETVTEQLIVWLEAVPVLAFIVVIGLLAWRLSGWRVGLFSVLGLALTANIGLWSAFVATLALVLSAELIVVLIGLPLGIAAALSDTAEGFMKPGLDFMQTMPAFVYLIPAVIFFGIGIVPGVIATVIFAMPPLVRLTNLGIRQVPHELVEAADAFGATTWQKLVKVQLPTAVPTIMAGVNQSIMLGLSMVVIAAMIGADGLGRDVLRSINTLNLGLGFEAGLAVVIMAVILDRMTQGFNRRSPEA